MDILIKPGRLKTKKVGIIRWKRIIESNYQINRSQNGQVGISLERAADTGAAKCQRAFLGPLYYSRYEQTGFATGQAAESWR